MKTQKQQTENLLMYKNWLDLCQKKSARLARASDKISLLRGIVFALAGLFLFLGYQQKNAVYFFLAVLPGTAFLMLIVYHNRLEAERECLKDSESVLEEYIARFDDGWKNFPADGARYLSDDFLEAVDLDLFGKSSLYQYICTASTTFGQDQLARLLCLSGGGLRKKSLAEIKCRQQAVLELSQKTEFCMKFETGARRLRKMEYEKCRKIMDDFFHALEKENCFPRVCRAIIWLFPAFTMTCLFLALAGVWRKVALPAFFALSFIQLMSAFLGYPWNSRALAPVYQMNREIAPYRKLFQLLETESFDNPYLNALQRDLSENGPASVALKELEEIAGCVCARHNIYAFLLYNSLFLYDYHCMERYGKWKEKNRGSLKRWLLALGKAEALISLSVISKTRRSCLPEIIDTDCGEPVFTALDLRHPLLGEAVSVGNDIKLSPGACVITGSNMSGKTTFMRSIGVNLALAYAGGFCAASGMRVSIMKLCTSIRTQDNVSEGISTFYAELLRIRKMIEASEKKLPMISLIDEIYKGTNSKDRIYAAEETVRRLAKPYAITLITTHDFELCDLENDADIAVKNYHFREYYKEEKLHFDYKLREGRCTTTNARYLLHMAGIL